MDFIKISVVLFLLIQFSNISSGCPEGSKSFIDDQGFPDCLTCRKCPKGTTAVENCTKEHDTICDKCTGDEYYHILSMQCKTCTVCDAGYYVNSSCSRFKDAVCNVCPTGTFSWVQSSITCKNCTDCRETKIIQACSRTADTVCEPIHGILQLVLLVVDIIISVVLLICCVRHAWRHRGNYGNGETQEMQTLQGNSSCGAIVVNPNKQTDKRYQRSESSEFTPSRYKVKATHVRNINVREKSDKRKCWVTGLVVISRDIMVVCDNNNSSVKLIDTKQNIVTSKIRLHSGPWDTALVPRDVTEESTTYDLIVTLPYARKLRYVRVNGDQITDTNKDISVEGLCYGIKVTQDRKLAVGYGTGKVEILDMDGQVLRRLQTDHGGALLFHHPYYLAVSPDSGILYVSDWGNNTLTSISTRDWSVMTKLEGLDSPQRLTVDRAVSVFVCCGNGTVHLVAATGDRSTQILGKENGLCEIPGAIGLSPEGDRMYVSGYESDHVQEFQLTEN